MEFKYSQKESYDSNDIENILEQHFTYVKKQIKAKQENKWNSQLVETKEALAAKEALLAEKDAELETVTKERENLNAKVESLETEITPFRKSALENKFSGLLKGKVVETAMSDVLNSLELTLETTEEEATESLEKLLETKPYFKAVVVGENPGVITKGKVETQSEISESDAVVKQGIVA